MSRKSRSLLPIINKEAHQKPKDLPPLSVNNKVRIQEDKLWKSEGIVIKKRLYHSYNKKLNGLTFYLFEIYLVPVLCQIHYSTY